MRRWVQLNVGAIPKENVLEAAKTSPIFICKAFKNWIIFLSPHKYELCFVLSQVSGCTMTKCEKKKYFFARDCMNCKYRAHSMFEMLNLFSMSSFLFSGPQPKTGEHHSGIQRLSVQHGHCECTHRGQPYSIFSTKTCRHASARTTDPSTSTASADPSSNSNLICLLLFCASLWPWPHLRKTPQTCLRLWGSQDINSQQHHMIILELLCCN